MIINSPGYRFRRGTGSPFDPLPNSLYGTSSGVPCQWCHYCKMSVETRSQAHNQHQVWGMKQWCKRCGNVTASAIYYQVEEVNADRPTPLFAKAKMWINEKEEKG